MRGITPDGGYIAVYGLGILIDVLNGALLLGSSHQLYETMLPGS